jgi:hypothetical protein
MSESKTTTKSGLGGAKEKPEPGAASSVTSPPESTSQSEDERAHNERARVSGLSEDAPEELLDAAEGEVADKTDRIGDEEEATVLDFLLGPTTPLEYDVDAMIDTPKGLQKLTLHFRQVDDTRMVALEDEWTEGIGPFAKVDRLMLNAAKVAEAGIYVVDTKGRKVELASHEWRGPIPSVADAVRGRFKFQPGILSSWAAEIDATAGMTNNRVGEARRAAPVSAEETITSAVGNS